MTAEQNYRLLQEIEANRQFLLLAYQHDPTLLARAEPRIRQLFDGPDTKNLPQPESPAQTVRD